MTRSLAPSALRMPISRVRSVTETIMMFMMPIPPTSKLMPAMTVNTRMTMLTIEVMVSSISPMLTTIKPLLEWNSSVSRSSMTCLPSAASFSSSRVKV